METLKSYFECITIMIVLQVFRKSRLKGHHKTGKVLNKARGLKEYKLEWWISQLEPLLEEFVKASKGTVNQEFWRNMFKCHSPKSCGAPETFDGWIIKFFPYDNEGKEII